MPPIFFKYTPSLLVKDTDPPLVATILLWEECVFQTTFVEVSEGLFLIPSVRVPSIVLVVLRSHFYYRASRISSVLLYYEPSLRKNRSYRWIVKKGSAYCRSAYYQGKILPDFIPFRASILVVNILSQTKVPSRMRKAQMRSRRHLWLADAFGWHREPLRNLFDDHGVNGGEGGIRTLDGL